MIDELQRNSRELAERKAALLEKNAALKKAISQVKDLMKSPSHQKTSDHHEQQQQQQQQLPIQATNMSAQQALQPVSHFGRKRVAFRRQNHHSTIVLTTKSCRPFCLHSLIL